MAQAGLDLSTSSDDTFSLVEKLEAFAAATLSSQSGASRPADLTAGGVWLDTSAAPIWVLRIFDGTANRAFLTIDTASGDVTGTAPGAGVITGAMLAAGFGDALGVTSPDGSGLIPAGTDTLAALISFLDGLNLGAPRELRIARRAASGTAIDSNGAGLTQVAITDVDHNSIAGASVASNVITLPAGEYAFDLRMAAPWNDGARAVLEDVTGAAFHYGLTGYSTQNVEVSLMRRLVFSAATTLQIHKYQKGSNTSERMGWPASIPGVEEEFMICTIRRLD